jgi:hypothetical protein
MIASAKPRRSVLFIWFSPLRLWSLFPFSNPLYKIKHKKSTPVRNFEEEKIKKGKKVKFPFLFIIFSLTERQKSYIIKRGNPTGEIEK